MRPPPSSPPTTTFETSHSRATAHTNIHTYIHPSMKKTPLLQCINPPPPPPSLSSLDTSIASNASLATFPTTTKMAMMEASPSPTRAGLDTTSDPDSSAMANILPTVPVYTNTKVPGSMPSQLAST
mmetsp:Transcript_30234/g.48828  ORF Transcript_30234/g.48828 Transcript_30234/m.48828 type:complete len:126 (-) Transcript_30234:1014-1391(-)